MCRRRSQVQGQVQSKSGRGHTLRSRVALWMLLLAAAPVAAQETFSPPQTVSFPTADGGTVWADEYGEGPRGLVLAHGGRFTKESWVAQAPVFAAAGFRVVAIDFRGRGRSAGGSAGDSDEGYALDVLAAVRHLRRTGAESVAVLGASFGGWAAARAAAGAEPGEIDRLMLLASGADDPERLTLPKLFIVARDDPDSRGEPRLTSIRRQFESAPEPKELVVLEGEAHAQLLFDTDQADRLLEEILRFLTEPAAEPGDSGGTAGGSR